MAGKAKLRVYIGIGAEPLCHNLIFGWPRFKFETAHIMYLLCTLETAANLGLHTGFAAVRFEL
jgi:hypothetical protein